MAKVRYRCQVPWMCEKHPLQQYVSKVQDNKQRVNSSQMLPSALSYRREREHWGWGPYRAGVDHVVSFPSLSSFLFLHGLVLIQFPLIQFLILWWSPTINYFLLLLLHNCNVSVLNCNVNTWYVTPVKGLSDSQRGGDLQAESCCCCCNPSTQRAKAGGQQVQAQTQLLGKTLFQKDSSSLQKIPAPWQWVTAAQPFRRGSVSGWWVRIVVVVN